jgi:hypothetical protein
MPCVGFEPTIPASERANTFALDRSATVTGTLRIITQVCKNNFFSAAWNIFGKLYVF